MAQALHATIQPHCDAARALLRCGGRARSRLARRAPNLCRVRRTSQWLLCNQMTARNATVNQRHILRRPNSHSLIICAKIRRSDSGFKSERCPASNRNQRPASSESPARRAFRGNSEHMGPQRTSSQTRPLMHSLASLAWPTWGLSCGRRRISQSRFEASALNRGHRNPERIGPRTDTDQLWLPARFRACSRAAVRRQWRISMLNRSQAAWSWPNNNNHRLC
jgi:hypothetical protein